MSPAGRRVGGVETWTGAVELEGECVVAKGGVLRLAAGCRVAPPPGAVPPRFIVEGTLIAEGSRWRPVRLNASIAAAGGWVLLTRCRLNGPGSEGLHLFGPGHRLERVSVSGFDRGLFLRDGSAEARRLELEGCPAAATVGSGGRLTWDGGGVRADAGSAPPRVLVQGELSARELTLDSSLAADGGRVDLSRCRLRGRGGDGLSLLGGAHRLERVALEGFGRAFSLREGAATARALTISGGLGGVEIAEGASLDWEGGSISAAPPARARVSVKGRLAARGLRVDGALALEGGCARLSRLSLAGEDGGALALEALTLDRCGAGAAFARGGRLAWEGVDAAKGARAVLSVEGELVARGGGREFVLEASVASLGGRVELADCRLEGPGVEGVTLRGCGHRLERASLSGFDCGLSLREGEASARGVTFARCATAAAVGEGGRFFWEGGGARDGGGVLVAGGQAVLRGLTLDACRGVRVEDGAVEIDGLDGRDVSGPCVDLPSAGFASLREVRVAAGDALAAAGGHVHLAGRVEGGVGLSPRARVCAAPSSVPPGRVRALRAFILATGRLPVLGAAYRSAAALAVGLFAAWAHRQPEISGAWAHRSWVAGGWEPGASDIDLALSARELSSPRSRSWLARAQGLHARARRLFPALGELLIAEESEWREAAASGLPRPGEWSTQARVLAGRLPEPVPAAPAAATLGARLEAAMAYTRLMDVCFHPEMPEELARREAAKAALDLLRYLSPEGERGRAQAREGFRAGLAASEPEWAERLRALAAPGRAHRAACSLAAAAARRWAGGAPEPAARAGAPGAASGTELSRALEPVEAARREFGGAVSGAVFDTLHRSYLVVDPALSEEELAEGLGAWSRRAAATGRRPALPVVLTPRGWSLWRAAAYQDFPAALASWPAGGEPALETAGGLFPGERRAFWGEYLPPRPSAEDSAAALAQGRAQFRAIRRHLLGEARVSRAAAHHILTRTACLALAARGLPAPDFDLDAALSGLDGFAPSAAAGLRRAASGDWAAFEAAAAELLPPAFA